VPENLEGRFKIEIQPTLGPFEWVPDDTWHEAPQPAETQ